MQGPQEIRQRSCFIYICLFAAVQGLHIMTTKSMLLQKNGFFATPKVLVIALSLYTMSSTQLTYQLYWCENTNEFRINKEVEALAVHY